EDTLTEESATTEKTEEEKGPIVYPDTFSAGFGRGDITPKSLPMQTSKISTAEVLKSKLYITCVAVHDGENTALFFGLDRKEITESFEAQGKKIIKEAFGIPSEYVFFNATHSHTAPLGDSPDITQWTKEVFAALKNSAEAALRDLAPAEIYTGRGDTTGLNFVRRYVMADGTYKGIHSGNPSTDYKEHESKADPELRTIRFERDGKDIVMVNWQCHAASDASYKVNGKSVISADFIDKLRSGVEKDLDVHLAYYNGASGNIGMKSEIKSEQICHSTDDLGKALADVVKEALQDEQKVNSGKIYASTGKVTGEIFKDDAERRAAANAAHVISPSASDADRINLLKTTGINSYYEAIHIGERARLGATQDIPLFAISFGDIAFAGAPFEMADKTGIQIREGAEGFQTTFICAYTGGSMGYMASEDMYPHGEYEVYCSRFVQGTSEACVAEICRMLSEQKNK
ncbi:MAG: hypothetical protein IKU24_04910, partial [Clostridia bacterium]|nr:hypothetical protein [Clostridia bacterium]